MSILIVNFTINRFHCCHIQGLDINSNMPLWMDLAYGSQTAVIVQRRPIFYAYICVYVHTHMHISVCTDLQWSCVSGK